MNHFAFIMWRKKYFFVLSLFPSLVMLPCVNCSDSSPFPGTGQGCVRDTRQGTQGPALLICAFEELKAGPGAQPAAPEEGRPLQETCVPGEAVGPPPPGCREGRGVREAGGGRGRPRHPLPLRARGQRSHLPPGHPVPLNQEPPPTPRSRPPGTRHPQAGRHPSSERRGTPAALPAGARGRPLPAASCGLGPRHRPALGVTTWPVPPRPAAAPRRLALRLAARPPPSPSAPAQPRARLTPRSRRGSAGAGWAPCYARCRRLPWWGRGAGRRRAGGARLPAGIPGRSAGAGRHHWGGGGGEGAGGPGRTLPMGRAGERRGGGTGTRSSVRRRRPPAGAGDRSGSAAARARPPRSAARPLAQQCVPPSATVAPPVLSAMVSSSHRISWERHVPQHNPGGSWGRSRAGTG